MNLALQFIHHGLEPHCLRGVYLVAGPSLQIARVGLAHPGKKKRYQPMDNEGQDLSTVVKDPPLPPREEKLSFSR